MKAPAEALPCILDPTSVKLWHFQTVSSRFTVISISVRGFQFQPKAGWSVGYGDSKTRIPSNLRLTVGDVGSAMLVRTA